MTMTTYNININASTIPSVSLDTEEVTATQIDEAPVTNKSVDTDNSDSIVPETESREIYIKSIGENRIGAYGIVWGSEKERDLHDEYFTQKTRDMTAILDAMGKIPMIFDHGQDDAVMKSTPFAAVDYMDADDKGLWFEAQVQKHDMYKEYIRPLIAKKKLYPSSGTLPAAKRVTKSGEITRWPIVEMTATPTPAEYRMLDVPISEIKAAYKSIGVTIPDSMFTDDEQPEAEKVVDDGREAAVSKLLREFENLKINYYKFELENEYDY